MAEQIDPFLTYAELTGIFPEPQYQIFIEFISSVSRVAADAVVDDGGLTPAELEAQVAQNTAAIAANTALINTLLAQIPATETVEVATQGQRIFTFSTLELANSVFNVSGLDVDGSVLVLGVDYTLRNNTQIATTDSYPLGSYITGRGEQSG